MKTTEEVIKYLEENNKKGNLTPSEFSMIAGLSNLAEYDITIVSKTA